MTQMLTKSTLSAALLACSVVVASAADMSGGAPGGIKDYRGNAVPVPVPVPYEETYKYYIAGHLGWTFASNGTMKLNADAGGSGAPSMPTYGDLQGPHVVGLAIGRYITPSIRAELGFDYRAPQRPLKASATQYYTGRVTGNVLVTDPATGNLVTAVQTNTYDVARNEEISVSNHTFLLNAYYDMNRGGTITPFIGAGVGFVKRDVSRTTNEIANCRAGVNSVDTTNTACQFNDTTFPPGYLVQSFGPATFSDNRTGFGLAAALMAGATYHITARTHWDLGYRMMYQAGKVAIVAPSLGGFSSLDVGARLDHEIRTGLRFDLW